LAHFRSPVPILPTPQPLVILGFELRGLIPTKQAPYYFSHSTSPFFVLVFFKIGPHEIFARTGFELQSS
jgi:hypothetical protein